MGTAAVPEPDGGGEGRDQNVPLTVGGAVPVWHKMLMRPQGYYGRQNCVPPEKDEAFRDALAPSVPHLASSHRKLVFCFL